MAIFFEPNGVLYITTDNNVVICSTTDFKDNRKIKYATQSGPMLLSDGKIHPDFKEGSANLNIRNGVVILPDNTLVFAMSKKKLVFTDWQTISKHWGARMRYTLTVLFPALICLKRIASSLMGILGLLLALVPLQIKCNFIVNRFV